MDKNRELALKLWPDKSWHEYATKRLDAEPPCIHCGKCGEDNRNFTTPNGIHLLLREMMKRGDFQVFLDHLEGDGWLGKIGRINIDLILDTTGRLRDAANDFLPPLKETMTAIEAANREVAEKLGLCNCKPFAIERNTCRIHGEAKYRIDFSTEAGLVQLWKLMASREDFKDFNRRLNNTGGMDYVLDTGALLFAANKFLPPLKEKG